MTLLLTTLLACSPSLRDVRLNQAPPEDDTPEAGTGTASRPSTPSVGDSGDTGQVSLAWTVEVDATDPETWVHLDLHTGVLGADADPWTLRFQRYRVAVDGGVSGDGEVEVAWRDDAGADPLAVPDGGWITDVADGDDEDTEPDRAFDDWYDYDEGTHLLTPADRRWWVRDGTGAVWSLRFLGYYDGAGTSGFVSVEVTPVQGGEG